MLETIRQYALEWLTAAHDDLIATNDRHLEWCVTRAERADGGFRGPDAGRWLDDIEAEHDDMRHALRWGADTGEA